MAEGSYDYSRRGGVPSTALPSAQLPSASLRAGRWLGWKSRFSDLRNPRDSIPQTQPGCLKRIPQAHLRFQESGGLHPANSSGTHKPRRSPRTGPGHINRVGVPTSNLRSARSADLRNDTFGVLQAAGFRQRAPASLTRARRLSPGHGWHRLQAYATNQRAGPGL
jgi:hypothetical protein